MRFSIALIASSMMAVTATAQDGGLSELDALSRNADDPFAGVIAAEEREPVSVTLRALNKITARNTDIEVEMHQIARFGSLEIQPRTCDKRPPEEFPETTAFLEIYDVDYNKRQSDLKVQIPEVVEDEIVSEDLDPLEVKPSAFDAAPVAEPERPAVDAFAQGPTQDVLDGPQAEGINIFKGWMFASSPALNPLEHGVYDVWVIDCKTRIVEN